LQGRDIDVKELERFTNKSSLFAQEYVRVTPGWWRLDTPTIMSGLVVRW
jgi:hypothetical protein